MRQPPLHVAGRPDNGHTEASFIEAHQPARAGVQTDEADVGEVLRRMDAGRAMTDAEREQHIADCTWLMERSYDLFQQHGNPSDRDDAVLWMHRLHEAIRGRRPAVKAAMEAKVLREVEAGAAYFLDQADRDRELIARRARGA